MLEMHVSEVAADLKQYFKAALVTSDYYVEKGQVKGYWNGEASKELGLKGFVEQEHFDRLVDNLHPLTGEKLTPRTRTQRRISYDFTFNAPKSVSIVYGLSDFETRNAIRVAFETAIKQTMIEVEQEMYTRVRKNGQNTERRTGNMVWPMFVHDTARPLNGIPDPHLHAHCIVFNVTKDVIENRWKAGEFGHIKENAPYFEAVFHNHFAQMLKTQGFGITPTKTRWEITGIPRKMVRTFSQRTQQIEDIIEKEKITSPKQKAKLAVFTRDSKKSLKSPEEIQNNWYQRYIAAGGEPIDQLKKVDRVPEPTIDQVMERTISHLFERQSTVTTREAMQTALRFGVGAVTQEQVHMAFYDRGALLKKHKGTEYMTMPHVLKEENAMLDSVRNGRGTKKAYVTEPIQFQADYLNKNQKKAVQGVLESKDFVTAIMGKAGVGKTTVMKEIKHHLKQSNKELFAFAISADASRGTLRGEGFTGADTVAKLLHDKKLQQQVKGQVIWIDEASQIGVQDMNQILTIAKKQQARVILTGDTHQHASVSRGDAFRLMHSHAGIKTANIDKIIRQKGFFYNMAVKKMTEKSIFGALETFEVMEAFKEITTADERYKALADEYCKSVLNKKKVLVVSPTHKEADHASDYIRERLKFAGIVRGKEYHRTRLKSLSSYFSEVEKCFASSYTPGQIIQLNNNISGLTRGDQFVVVNNSNPEHLTVKRKSDNEYLELPLKHSKRFDVFEEKPIALAKGDKIRITKNSTTKYGHKRLNNGAQYEIARTKANGDLILNNGYVLDKDFAHLQHAYVATSYSSQSKTVDNVLIAQSQMSFGKASFKEQFYVSVSRGRTNVSIYTDDKKGLKKELTKSQQRLSATELMRGGKHSSWFSDMKQALKQHRDNIKAHAKKFMPQQAKPQPAR